MDERKYEDKNLPLNFHRGKGLNILGTKLDFTKPGEVRVGMTNYINFLAKKIINIGKYQDTSASEYLFNIH